MIDAAMTPDEGMQLHPIVSPLSGTASQEAYHFICGDGRSPLKMKWPGDGSSRREQETVSRQTIGLFGANYQLQAAE